MEYALELTPARREARDHRLLDECQCRLTCTWHAGLSAVTEHDDAVSVSSSALEQ